MISLCTVVVNQIERHAEVLIDSVLANTSLVKEVLIAKTDTSGGLYDLDVSWEHRDIKFRKFRVATYQNFGHPEGLHACLDLATQDYIIFVDPDVFLHKDCDKIFMDYLSQYDLKAVGVSHHAPVTQAMYFFPVIFGMLIRRADLPPKTWKEGLWQYRSAWRGERKPDDTGPKEENRHMDGKFLLRGPLPGYCHLYPNQSDNAIYDEGNALWLWFHENNWKWLAFQTTDCHNYTTSYYRGNFKLPVKPAPKKLLFHGVGSTHNREWDWLEYKKAYLESERGKSMYGSDESLRDIRRNYDRVCPVLPGSLSQRSFDS